MKLLLDLCCGLGGWSEGFKLEGWSVLGVDFCAEFGLQYPGEMICADLNKWEGWRKLKPRLIVASTPCEQYTRFSMPWTRARKPPLPSRRLWDRSVYIGRVLGVPVVNENVRGAQWFHGRADGHSGPFYLWGPIPGRIPKFTAKKKESYGGEQRAQRAKIPLELSSWLASGPY